MTGRIGTAGAPARLGIRLRPAAVRLRRLGLQPEGCGQRAQFGRRIHDDPGVSRKRSSSRPASDELLSFPFLFMTGHKLVRFSAKERERLRRSSSTAGCCSPTTATTTSTACTRAASSRRCGRSSRKAGRLPKLAGTPPALPQLLHLRGRAAADLARAERMGGRAGPRLPARPRAPRPPRRPLQQQGLRLRVGLRLAQQAVPARGQHEVRGQHRRLRHDGVTPV